MDGHTFPPPPVLLDERGPVVFRDTFGSLLRESDRVDCAIANIRLGAVDFTADEVLALKRFRVLVAEVNARTVEGEAYAMSKDPEKRRNLLRLLRMFSAGILEIRSAPLGGWSPDFTVFCQSGTPRAALMGVHWFRKPFPHRGPAFAVRFSEREAAVAGARFQEVWRGAHDIGTAIQGLMNRVREPGS
jgi:hypothetical protein